jgi:translocation and assembly module TamB
MVKADVRLSAQNGGQAVTVSGTAADLVYETVTLDSADISGQASDLFSAPKIDGTFAIRNLKAGGLEVLSANGTAARQGESTRISAEAELADGRARASGTLQPRGNGVAVALGDFAFSRSGIDVSLAAPTTVVVEDGTARFDGTTVRAGSGTVVLSGQAGAALDLSAQLVAVPASLINAVSPELGAEGSISGRATLTGTPAAPNGRFQADWKGASVAASRNAGLGSLAITTQGELANGSVHLDSRITGAESLAIQVAGRLGTAEGAPLSLAVTGSVPLSLGNRQLASRGAALRGELNVDISVIGTAAAPQFSGRITSEGGGFVDPETGIALRDLSLAASLSGNQLAIDRLTAQSGEGNLSASGSVGLADGFPVDVRAEIRQARYVDGTVVATRSTPT